MTGIVPTVGENRLAELALKTVDMTLRLFVNDYVPVDATTAAKLVQMSTQGYVAAPLDKDFWTIEQVDGRAVGTHEEQVFTFAGGAAVSVYGYWIDAAGVVIVAERFAAPLVIEEMGDQIRLTPRIRFSKEES